jgi:DNA-binding MarR family transcriptional regulator
MTWSLDDATGKLDAPPWEAFGRSLVGHGGFSHSGSMRGAIAWQPSRHGRPSSRAMASAKSGLTRRGVIYEYIRGHPGTHVRGMARELRLGTGDLHYHLFWLEKHGFVKTKKSGFYRYVFPTMVFREEQEVLLGVLTQETPREILLCLLLDSTMTQSDIARSLGHSQPTISWHIDRLVQLGMISRRKPSTGTTHEVTADRDDVLRFVKSYHPEVWKRWAGRLGALMVSARVKRPDEREPILGMGQMPPAVVELIGKR